MQLAKPIFLPTVFVCCPLPQSSYNRLDIPDPAVDITHVENGPNKQQQENPQDHERSSIA